MSIDTWGLIPKSQVDDETIEEAIVRLIGDHEADSSAHLGDGESIDVHRKNTVVDHPVGSVLADKSTFSEIFFNFDFSNLSVLGITGDVTNSNWPTCALYFEYGATNKSEFYMTPPSPSPFLVNSVDVLFQVCAHFDSSNTTFKAWLGIGIESATPSDGFGFVLNNGVLKAVMSVGSTKNYSGALTCDTTVAHIYRAQYNAGFDEIYYFIDGVLVATLAGPSVSWDTDGGPRCGVEVVSSNDGNMYLSDLRFARGI